MGLSKSTMEINSDYLLGTLGNYLGLFVRHVRKLFSNIYESRKVETARVCNNGLILPLIFQDRIFWCYFRFPYKEKKPSNPILISKLVENIHSSWYLLIPIISDEVTRGQDLLEDHDLEMQVKGLSNAIVATMQLEKSVYVLFIEIFNFLHNFNAHNDSIFSPYPIRRST